MDAAAKQQVVERIKQANNILVTVSNNPSVDQLAACIGLTLLLNRMEKHATAVFSGKVPSTLEFLQPEKTIEATTDSLRDFIISLDKEKADKLRYKVEDQVVRIFITPYKTSLSDKDLVFSQGEYNVELVLALGITDKSQIDQAITVHGKILHDATVISFNAGNGKTQNIGQINWQEPTASSLCEMIVSISEAFGTGLIDNQMATSLLTGIVAETARFSNAKTTPKVMTMSAQLMAAGANQQLIVSKLEPPNTAQTPRLATMPKSVAPEGTLNVPHEKVTVQAKLIPTAPDKAPTKNPTADGLEEIHIDAQGNLSVNTPPVVPPTSAPSSPPPPSASTSTNSALPPVTAADMPGAHTLLNPQSRQPILDSPFTGSTQSSDADMSMDMLNGTASADNNLFSHGKDVSAPSMSSVIGQPDDSIVATPAVDSARSAVADAVAGAAAAAQFNPDILNQPAVPASSAVTNSAGGTPALNLPVSNIGAAQSQTPMSKVAPPNMPPPLTLPSGPIVSNAPSSATGPQ